MHGATELQHLAESVNEAWSNSNPLCCPRPQPDYSVGFGKGAFTEEQLARLRPFVGDYVAGVRSPFMATWYMFFPFLTCEVKCGAGGLDTAERQNAHSVTLAVRGIIHLFRQVGREGELHRRVIAFSISHNHEVAKLHGHYAEIYSETTKYYRQTIKSVGFTNEEDRWISYSFTKAIYAEWAPQHLRRICSVTDTLPIIDESALDLIYLP